MENGSNDISKENVIVDVSIEENTQKPRRRSKIINILRNSKTLEGSKKEKQANNLIKIIKN